MLCLKQLEQDFYAFSLRRKHHNPICPNICKFETCFRSFDFVQLMKFIESKKRVAIAMLCGVTFHFNWIYFKKMRMHQISLVNLQKCCCLAREVLKLQWTLYNSDNLCDKFQVGAYFLYCILTSEAL